MIYEAFEGIFDRNLVSFERLGGKPALFVKQKGAALLSSP
jgi:hypothetical protein